MKILTILVKNCIDWIIGSKWKPKFRRCSIKNYTSLLTNLSNLPIIWKKKFKIKID